MYFFFFIFGLIDLSAFSLATLLSEFLEFKSSAVYGFSGTISKISAFLSDAIICAILFVFPVAEKYTTNIFFEPSLAEESVFSVFSFEQLTKIPKITTNNAKIFFILFLPSQKA